MWSPAAFVDLQPQRPLPAAHRGVVQVVVVAGGGGVDEEEEEEEGAGGGALGGGASSDDGFPGGAPGFSCAGVVGSAAPLPDPRARVTFDTDGSAPPEHAATRIPTPTANETRMFQCLSSKRRALGRDARSPGNSVSAGVPPRADGDPDPDRGLRD